MSISKRADKEGVRSPTPEVTFEPLFTDRDVSHEMSASEQSMTDSEVTFYRRAKKKRRPFSSDEDEASSTDTIIL